MITKTQTISETSNVTFNELEKQSGQLAEQISEITKAIGEITEGMTTIVEQVEQLSDTSSNVNGRMTLMEKLSNDQNQISVDLMDMAGSLRDASHRLREKMTVFKL